MRRIRVGINQLNRIPIVSKMIIGYIFLVVLPLLLFGSLLYDHLYNNVIGSYATGKQSLINQAGNSFKVNLAQVNSIYSLFQYDPIVIDYLTGQYQTDSDQVYNYNKYIRPMFQFAYLGNKSIQTIKLYKVKKNILPVSGEIEDLTNLDLSKNALKQLDGLKNEQGMWISNQNKNRNNPPYLSYYQKIYDDNYTNELAILKVTFNEDIFNTIFKAINVDHDVSALISSNGKSLYQSKKFPVTNQDFIKIKKQIETSSRSFWIDNKKKLLINNLTLKNTNLNIYFISPINQVFASIHKKTIIFGLLFLGLLCLLSAIYYATASTLTQRVLLLARHMRNVDENRLTLFKGDKGNDEIGYLTHSYNSLIQRIDDLMNKVHRAELLKKEADYLVLQAQVNPHFLYNTLESIRMLAEMNEDEEVVEATYTLSKLLRYNLSSDGNTATLKDEIENIKDYLSIQKLRMGDKLTFTISFKTDVDNFVCPRFILQPLVENCINHGLSNIRKPGKIEVEIKESDVYTFVIISDNGAGITEERLAVINGVLNNTLNKMNLKTQSSGLGLYNVNERVKVFFNEESGLEVKSHLGYGTSLILKFSKIGGD